MNFVLSFYCQFFFKFISLLKKKSRIVSLLSCVFLVFATRVHVLENLNTGQMEFQEGEQNNQYLVERKPNAYRSMKDYRNPPWVSAPSYMVPPTNAPYGNAYNPSWGNHLNLSWGPKPLQYAPPSHSQCASTSQPRPPQLNKPF